MSEDLDQVQVQDVENKGKQSKSMAPIQRIRYTSIPIKV